MRIREPQSGTGIRIYTPLSAHKWMTARRRAERIALYVTIVFVCLVIVFPLYWLVINALIPGPRSFPLSAGILSIFFSAGRIPGDH